MDEQINIAPQESVPTTLAGHRVRSLVTSKKGIYSIVIAVLVISGALFFLKERPVETTAGFLNRTFLDLKGLDRNVKINGTCLSSYIVYGSGIDDTGQHYAVTFVLNENPKNDMELLRVLEKSSCKEEQNEAEDTLIKRLSLEGRRDVLVSVSYKNKNGKRLALPI